MDSSFLVLLPIVGVAALLLLAAHRERRGRAAAKSIIEDGERILERHLRETLPADEARRACFEALVGNARWWGVVLDGSPRAVWTPVHVQDGFLVRPLPWVTRWAVC